MSSAGGAGAGAGETGSIKATLPMWRCSKIMQLQREIHPTVLSSLEGVVDQVYLFYTIVVSHVLCFWTIFRHRCVTTVISKT